MPAVNEKCTNTITGESGMEVFWSVTTYQPKVLDIVAGLVLWRGEGPVTYPGDGAVTPPAGLPQYCRDVLDLREEDPDSVLWFHRTYGPYWGADLAVFSDAENTGVRGYSLARFQAEVRRLRVAVTLARAVAQRDRDTLAQTVTRSRHAGEVFWSAVSARTEPEARTWRPYEYPLELPKGYPRRPGRRGPLVARPMYTRAEDGFRYVQELDCEFRRAQVPLSPYEWGRVAAAWVEPLPSPVADFLRVETGDGLLEYAHEELQDLLRVPFARPYPWTSGGWDAPRIFLTWELCEVADFIRLGITSDICRGILPTHCASESCQRYFIPTRPRQIYCSTECQRAQAVRRYRRKAKPRSER